MLLGVVIGLALFSFMGVGIEGFTVSDECCESGEMVEYDITGMYGAPDSKGLELRAKEGRTLPSGCNPGTPGSPSYTGNQETWTRRCAEEFPTPTSRTQDLSGEEVEQRGLSYGGADRQGRKP